MSIKSTKLDSIESKFSLIKGKELGKMRLCEFGVCADGVKRSCAKMEVKAGFHWTECMPASKGGPMPEGVTCCPKNHFGFLASGKMKVVMVETGEEQIISAGEAYYVPPKVCLLFTTSDILISILTMCYLLFFISSESTSAEYYGKLDA